MATNESLQQTSSSMPFLSGNNDERNLSSSGSLSNSMSLSGTLSSRNPSSQLVKTYRQAANLFLTRRLPEALSTLEPLVNPPSVEEEDPLDAATNGENEAAPIALAPRGIRIKVWILYVTLLNAVVELGLEEGKHAFGSARWKSLVAKARDGTIWDDVVQIGYGGVEGNVDADVVVNLATLLLAHSPSQTLNQTRLEAYLSAMAHPQFDVTSHLSSSQRLKRTSNSHNGTNTPRDLQTTIKLLELYTLHVLPRNGEWEYAREFITVNELLDEDRKEAFLQALTNLKEEQQQAAAREKEIQKAQLEQLENQRREEEEEQRRQQAKREEERRREEAKRLQKKSQSDVKDNRPKPLNTRGGISGGTASRPRPKKDLARQPPATLIGRFSAILANLQSLILTTTQSLRSNPVLLLRTVLFLLAFAIAFGRREMRARIKRAVDQAWFKVRGTIGMGMKVSSL